MLLFSTDDTSIASENLFPQTAQNIVSSGLNVPHSEHCFIMYASSIYIYSLGTERCQSKTCYLKVLLSKWYPDDCNAEKDSDNRSLDRQFPTSCRNPYHVKEKAAHAAVKYHDLSKRAEAQPRNLKALLANRNTNHCDSP
jgi:hypothetical protein